jgi:cytidylate kinase
MAGVPAVTPVVTIDGPSGSGKGTIGLLLAQRLGWHFLDSGALYRLLGLAADRASLPLTDEHSLAALAKTLHPAFVIGARGELLRVFWEGEDVSEALRAEACGEIASRVAVMPSVRDALLEPQRAMRRPPGLVADGRDMGSIVFPDAVLKVFLTASREERARRRYKQLKDLGIDANLSDILQHMAERDERDRTRRIAPLRPVPDAVVIDTTPMDVQEVCDHILWLLRQRVKPRPAMVSIEQDPERGS